VSDVGLDLDPRRRHRPPRRRALGCLAVLIALAVLLGGGFVVYSYGLSALKARLSPPPDYSGSGSGKVLVRVKQGDTSTDIAATLDHLDVVKSAEAFTDASRRNPRAVSIQAGYYRLHHQMSAKSALAALLNHDNRLRSVVTVPEGLRVDQIVKLVAAKTPFSQKQLNRVLSRPSRIGLPSYAHGNPEGFLFPDTYEVTPGESARTFLAQMVARFRTAADDLHLQSGAQRLGRSIQDVVTVASIVQAEGRRSQDLPKIARVIYNRLRHGKPLQLDTTIVYIFKTEGKLTTTKQQRASDSPYNTYKHKGLPPTPISAPGDAALKAALRPADGSWMYFVTTNPSTGATSFATTYPQHLRNVAKFRDYCRSHRC
jgi:peptidoglycan lytic transglycosylase G